LSLRNQLYQQSPKRRQIDKRKSFCLIVQTAILPTDSGNDRKESEKSTIKRLLPDRPNGDPSHKRRKRQKGQSF
jgi:hypothetical protein